MLIGTPEKYVASILCTLMSPPKDDFSLTIENRLFNLETHVKAVWYYCTKL